MVFPRGGSTVFLKQGKMKKVSAAAVAVFELRKLVQANIWRILSETKIENFIGKILIFCMFLFKT